MLCTGGLWNARASPGNQCVAPLEKEGNKLKTWEVVFRKKRGVLESVFGVWAVLMSF